MAEHCPKCKHKYSKYPIKDDEGNLIVKNLFKMDLVHLMFMISIFLIIFGFTHFTKQCQEAVDDPCGFCAKSNCCWNDLQPCIINSSNMSINFSIPDPTPSD